MNKNSLESMILPDHLKSMFSNAKSVQMATTVEQLNDLACGKKENNTWTVSYELPDGKTIEEANVVRVKNGVSANYTEAYMRRRDPDCLFIADSQVTDKPKYEDKFGESFDGVRDETFKWLEDQDIIIFAFEIGQPGIGGEALAVCPANAGFFALGLGLLQGIVDPADFKDGFKPSTVVYVAPPFRHTHFDGKQVVVHNRVEQHEIFSYNLYPGPSAKKGIYGALIHQGAGEGWVTAHCSAVQVVTPYDNTVTFMHEGASGGGKTEMLQQPHRLSDGRLLLGRNIFTGDERYLEIPRTCDLHPVCDDMGLCHPGFQEDNGKLWVMDAENSWFIRVDNIQKYGTDPDMESLTVNPPTPLLFLNMDATEGSTALIWEHIEDEPGKVCPNPRVVIPRETIKGITSDKMSVDIRSFGVRTPPCSSESPSYGIIGLLHILPPALAWLWRLVAPRGYANPSIVDTGAMSSEGVGSYWPFATGRKVDQANLLLEQFLRCNQTKYILTPNQHVGCWETSFMPQWLTRDYLARRGHANFQSDKLEAARCSLLGYALHSMRIEGTPIPTWMLQVNLQREIGNEVYDTGAKQLIDFFHDQIKKFLHPDLDPLGKKIIECCLNNGTVEDYEKLIDFSK